MKQPGGYSSKETALSGLPKMVKMALTSSNQGAPPSATFQNLLFDFPPKFNYGPYTFLNSSSGAQYREGIIVNEPGVYEIHAQVGWIANSQLVSLLLFLNGGTVWRDGTTAQFYSGATLSNGQFVVHQNVCQICELVAGDVISLVEDQVTSGGGPATTFAGAQWISVEKKEGRT